MAQRTGWERSRLLLRRVRDVMGAPGSAQERLDKVVGVIAAEMGSQVCSVYVRRGGALELFATEGLKPEAVRVTRLDLGEGLVGLIAEQAQPLALTEAQSHPKFAYRPETGEEIYHSLMGVPILRGGRVTGVLVVQNRAPRGYTEDEIETLETVAMVVAEVAALPELVESEDEDGLPRVSERPTHLVGTALNDGIAIGTAVLHEPRIAISRMIADDPEREASRLGVAIRQMYTSLDDLLSAADIDRAGEHRDVLETYRMFAHDRGWIDRIREALRGGLSAEAAVRKVQDDTRARMRQVRDPYLRERMHDLDDLGNRLLQHLVGESAPAERIELPADAVIVARSMGPAELLDYDRSRLRAVILEEGSPTAHVAIVARALDIPMLGGVDDALGRIAPGDRVIVDGDHRQVLVRPGPDVEETVAVSLRAREERRAIYARLRDRPAVTLDGHRIGLQINAGLLIDMQHLVESGADGVGLYRTEIPFMVRNSFPDVDEQVQLYSQVLDMAGDRPVVFRTLDIGGDKLLPYWRAGKEDNPAMGWRAIRLALDRPFILRLQLRALLRASAGRRLDVMFPMITEVAEFDRARAILDAETRRETGRGRRLPDRIRVGAMLEVPALVWQFPALLSRVDFLSVGSNDLLQFLLAADRGNPRIAGRYDVLSPGVLAFLRSIVEQCDAAGVPITFCGEMAGHPLEAMALMGLGFRAVSTPPPATGPVKRMTLSLAVEPLARYVGTLCRSADHSVRAKLHAYAVDHGVAI